MTGSDSISFLDPTPVAPAVPEFLGRYYLGCQLATGGMATLYLAIAADSTYVQRPLALKRIHPHLAAEASFVEMFIDEARIASRLNHPNICGVLDFGEADGTYFMTMEYLVGEPLSRLLSTLTQSDDPTLATRMERVAAQIVADACEGLHAAHELLDEDGRPLHVVHRDVSPSNLFVTYDGLTRVVDFGIASAADRIHNTLGGGLKGKFGYMAPEQLCGDGFDHRADVWALGVVLWEAIALRRLFRRENPTRTMLATLEGTVPPLRAVVPGIDPALEAIVERALAADPVSRYPSALAMAADLQSFLASSGAPSARAEVEDLIGETFPEGETAKRRVVRDFVDEWRSGGRCPESGTYPSVRNPKAHVHDALPGRAVGAERDPAPQAPRRGWPFAALATAALCLGIAAGSIAWNLRDALTLPQLDDPPPMRSVASSLEVVATSERTAPRAAPAARVELQAPIAAKPTDLAPRGFGIVDVTTEGRAAQVYHRGRPLGPTPGRFTLPTGRQTLSLRPADGGRTRTVVVVVRSRRTAHVREEL